MESFFFEKLQEILDFQGKGGNGVRSGDDLSSSVRLVSQKRGRGEKGLSPGGKPEGASHERGLSRRGDKPRFVEVFRKGGERRRIPLSEFFRPEIKNSLRKRKMDSPHEYHQLRKIEMSLVALLSLFILSFSTERCHGGFAESGLEVSQTMAMLECTAP